MTQPVPAIPIVAGVLANVSVKVISADPVASTAVIRVIDNNGGFLSAQTTLPWGVITATQFAVVIGDVLESADAKQTTGVVRWIDGLMWSPSPSGVPAYSTAGWRKIGSVAIP